MVCSILENLDSVRELLSFPDVDDNEWIVNQLMGMLGVARGTNPNEQVCPNKDLSMDKDEILEKIDKAKLSILRGQHTRDKVANILVNLVERIQYMDSHSPMVTLGEMKAKSDAWREAEAYTLRIKTVRNSKKGKNDESNN